MDRETGMRRMGMTIDTNISMPVSGKDGPQQENRQLREMKSVRPAGRDGKRNTCLSALDW